jgi:L-alanine-DL-glutamate epimerase-like enolase superfamily enzyme
VETDAGITGIGEGGSRDTVEQCAGMLIGEDPARIDHLWQSLFRGYFYPPGREKLHGLGALDLALWDIKGKALGVPIYELLGGLSRDHIECYSTGFPSRANLAETARALPFPTATRVGSTRMPLCARPRSIAAWSGKRSAKKRIGRSTFTPAWTSPTPSPWHL